MMNFFTIFNKKPKQVKEDVPIFNITETHSAKSDFEVTELSYEEYLNFPSKERRLSQRNSQGK